MSLKWLVFKIIFLGIFDVIAIQLALVLGSQIGALLGIAIAVYAVIVNVVFLRKDLFPWRWIIPAFGGMALLVLYPMGYSVVVAFTNYGDGHLLNKQQVISQRLAETYAAPDAPTYEVYIYRSDEDDAFRFWLIEPNGDTSVYYPEEGDLRPVEADDPSFGPRDENGIPLSLDGYNRLPAGGALRYANSLQTLTIGEPPEQVRFTRLGIAEAQQAALLQPRWSYDPAADTLTNLETGDVYHPERGNFVTGEGADRQVLQPGFPAIIGLENILRVINDQNVREPFWRVFLWTLVFAAGSVLLTLALGLAFAMVLNARDIPLRPIFRSILIIPYAVPGWLMVTTLRGLLNPAYGPINMAIENVTGVSPQWFSDPLLAKMAVLLVNMYLGFPYMMLISLGVMQSIPHDMYEAATIDGANSRRQFRHITMPLLLVALAPLLVASFAFNFNNFTVIELFNNGGPPMSALTVAGHTDILLSYTYRLAFAGSTGTDYGFAAAISIFIFLIVAPITYFNFRLTRRFEEAAL
jgi:ABC-type sugar transport system permease subunit